MNISDLASRVAVAFVLNPVLSVVEDEVKCGQSPRLSVPAVISCLVPLAVVIKRDNPLASVERKR